MATGIIEVVAKGGYDVRFVARAPEKVEAVQKALTKSLEKQVQRGRLEESARDEILARVTGTTSLDELADRDLIIEAVVESLSVKEALFANLGEIEALCQNMATQMKLLGHRPGLPGREISF